MNRQFRRQHARDQRRGIDRSERVVLLPPAIDEFTIFDIPQTILDRVQSGEIESIRGEPVFKDNHGEWNEVCPALEGWIFTWQRISDEMDLFIDQSALEKLNRKLKYDMPIFEDEIAECQRILTKIRMAFRCADRRKLAAIATEAQRLILEADSNHGE